MDGHFKKEVGESMSGVVPDRWVVSEAELIELDAYKARDLVVKCFLTAQRITFAQTKETMGLPGDEKALERSVLGAVRVAFKRAGGDFDQPTKETIVGACDALASTAASWGTPESVVHHHQEQMMKVIGRLPE
ncbi:MAG: hypothetical protein CVT67_03780 [Actinobacteria bacterium HGW-Actinobacteria-7]|jgi:hypothetical protein|nr:MAG: hypothetical protein CVT67_03780 [Actinobacteria bacterium HGW-Actinobacteria-7]